MKTKKSTPIMESVKRQWTKQIMQEKGYSETTAVWMANRIESLIDYMQYGHAVIAYRRAVDGEFKFVKATLTHYKYDFKREYEASKVQEAVMYWDVEEQHWRRFRIENFLEWKAVG
ncbi:SH3 beta-barrel fold-containing protein [Bacteroides sp.]